MSSLTPNAEQCGQLHTVCKYPTKHQHHSNPMSFINLRIRSIVRNHDISVIWSDNFRLAEINKMICSEWLGPFVSHLFMVIIAMHSKDTPTLPYWRNGMRRHKRSPCVHVPWIKRNTLNGNTTIQNRQSATHKLKHIWTHRNCYLCSEWHTHTHTKKNRMR